jgi:hypothetical protein
VSAHKVKYRVTGLLAADGVDHAAVPAV